MPEHDDNQPSEKSYVEYFVRFSESCEKLLRRLLAALFILLFVSQTLLQFEPFRQMILRVEQLEGARQELKKLKKP
jgi:hypothetical protein